MRIQTRYATMVKSMTGYGKSELLLEGGKLTVEIKTLNGKNSDANIKTYLLPKDKELAVRRLLADSLNRGTLDFFLIWEPKASESAKEINEELVREYYDRITSMRRDLPGFGVSGQKEVDLMNNELLLSILRFPDVMETRHQDVITDENWPQVLATIEDAVAKVNEYRSREGQVLYADVTSRVKRIVELSHEVEALEAKRIEDVRKKLETNLEALHQKVDPSRFEQEMIYYLEKLDINEERVRLRQHCKYFMETIDGEEYPGRKLGFIVQEMGREINTTGSKANYADIQKIVVMMKDELEKVREQSMNIL